MLSLFVSLCCVVQEPVAAPPRFVDYPEQDAISYDVDLDVRLAERSITGSVTYRFRAVAAELDAIRLDATAVGDAWDVRFEDLAGGELRAEWRDGRVDVALGQTVAAGEDVTFRALCNGTPPDGFYFKESRYGEVLAFTDHYSIRARGWLPCEDHPADRAAFRTALTFPAGNRAIASGGTGAEGGGITPHPTDPGRLLLRSATASDIPPYMYAIVVGPFAEVREAGDPRLAPHLVYARDVAAAKRSLSHHAAWIRTMEQTFGPYAYAKYAVVQCPTRWGGFEAPGNVQLAEGIFEFPNGGVGTLAHELVHMWFGDGVGYAQWREVWLSEGFASYFGPWLHAGTGGPAFRESLERMRERWLRSREGRTRSIRWDGFRHPDLALNANTYPKGAWVLHMLRGELGDEAFFAALRAYYGRFRGTSVTTADFVDCVERSADRQLDWFFEQWLERPGCPELKIAAGSGSVASTGSAGPGDPAGSIVVEQVQRGEPYRFRLRLRWTGPDGAAVERVVAIDQRRTEIETGGAVRELAVDPEVELLYRPVQ